MRIAVLSDTHGNLTAFEAVLADIDARGVDQILHLGDVVGKGPRGSACCTLARQRCDVVLRGNWDVDILLGEETFPSDPLQWWREELSDADQDWLGLLPFCVDMSMGGRNFRAFHASSGSVHHRIFQTQIDDEWEAMFENTLATGYDRKPDVVIYGDIHRAYVLAVGDRTVINCGSVGNPFDGVSACYLLLESTAEGLEFQLIRVQYDIERELSVARKIRMPRYRKWEHMLRTGTA